MKIIGEVALQIVVLAVMLVGLFGLLTLVIPGLTIIWVAALVYGLVIGFDIWSGILFGIITLLMLFGNVVDNLFMGAGARKTGASWLSVGVALLGGIIGSLLMPPLGGLVLAMVGIFLVELIRIKDWRKAWESTRNLAMGCGWAGVTRFGIGIVMILLWWIWAFLINR